MGMDKVIKKEREKRKEILQRTRGKQESGVSLKAGRKMSHEGGRALLTQQLRT